MRSCFAATRRSSATSCCCGRTSRTPRAMPRTTSGSSRTPPASVTRGRTTSPTWTRASTPPTTCAPGSGPRRCAPTFAAPIGGGLVGGPETGVVPARPVRRGHPAVERGSRGPDRRRAARRRPARRRAHGGSRVGPRPGAPSPLVCDPGHGATARGACQDDRPFAARPDGDVRRCRAAVRRGARSTISRPSACCRSTSRVAAETLRGCDVKVCTVVSYPFGADTQRRRWRRPRPASPPAPTSSTS